MVLNFQFGLLDIEMDKKIEINLIIQLIKLIYNMEYYKLGSTLETNNPEKALFYYELAKLFEYKLALKHLEYLDKPNKLKHLINYNNNTINEDFINILMYWYNIIIPKTSYFYKDSNNINIVDSWINIWFAKNENQKKIDNELLNFEKYYDKYKNYEPVYLYEYVALIILYDQIPRNIFRNTYKAYATDNIALNYALYLIKYIDYLPFHICIPIIMSLIHTESLEVLKTAENIIKQLKEKYCVKYNDIFNSLNNIFINHFDRIKLFGRIPERNKFLNRNTSEEEKIYLKSL